MIGAPAGRGALDRYARRRPRSDSHELRPAFTLHLFGSPSLATIEGAPYHWSATQRHRLALLALLALSPRRSSSRDRALGLLWPERDMEQARQLLNQAVYRLRKTLGEDALQTPGEELVLNANVVGADVLDFEAALERGDHTAAAALYVGRSSKAST